MISGKSTGYDTEQWVGLGASVALHLLCLAIIFWSVPPHLPVTTVFTVTVEPPPARSPKKEIVSPSAQPSKTPPLETNRLSDENSIALKEQVRRGDNGGIPGQGAQGGPAQPSRQPQPPAPPRKEPAEERPNQKQPQTKQPEKVVEKPKESVEPKAAPSKAPLKKELALKDLKLDDATLSQRFGAEIPKPQSQRPNTSSQADLSKYAAFSRPPGSGAAFLGAGGVNDHLPSLPDGDITLLNAKANTYAGFVRRVAVQVFTQLRTQGWEQLSRREIQQLQDFTTIEAVLSPTGKFIRLQLIGGSGSVSFDSVVKLSVQSGAQDPNPPEGARAADGNIHFIFKARSWAAAAFNPRSGAPVEQRWILLATGLE